MESHPLRMRGLKLCFWTLFLDPQKVASFTDSWIETVSSGELSRPFSVASFTDAWIETCRESGWRASAGVASFTDVWVETSIRLISQTAQGVRPLRI